MERTRTVLVVDDAPEMQGVIARALSDSLWSVESVPDRRAASIRMTHGPVDVLVTGLGTLPDRDLVTLRRVRRCFPRTKVIVLTDSSSPESVIDALKGHAFGYFTAPFSDETVRSMVERAIAEPDWDDGIEVVSDRPEWICVRVSCRRLTADRLLQFCDELSSDLSDDERQNTGAAFREILMNAIEHGGELDPAKRVEMTRIRTPGALIYLVRDPGQGFDASDLPHAAVAHPDDPTRHVLYRHAHGMRAGGFGLLMARGLVDELAHSAKGNESVLIKYLVTPPAR